MAISYKTHDKFWQTEGLLRKLSCSLEGIVISRHVNCCEKTYVLPCTLSERPLNSVTVHIFIMIFSAYFFHKLFKRKRKHTNCSWLQ